jgi:hypothetical protein
MVGKGTQVAQDAAQSAFNQAQEAVNQASSKFYNALDQLNQIVG